MNCSEKFVFSFNGVLNCIALLLFTAIYVGGIIYADEAPLTSDKDKFPAVAPLEKTTSVKKMQFPAPGAANTCRAV